MKLTAYNQTFVDSSNTGEWAYALTIPGASIVASGSYVRVKFAPTATIKDAYIGLGAGNANFANTSAQLKKNGAEQFQSGWTDPVACAVVAGQPLVLRLDVPLGSGQSYPFITGKAGHQWRYKAGQAGADNALLDLPSGYSVMDGWAAMVEAIEVADSLSDFNEQPTPQPTSIGVLAEMESRVLVNQMFAAGQDFAGEPGKRNCFSLQVASDKTAIAFADMIELTLDMDSEVTLRAFTAPPEATLFNAQCNVNFLTGAPGPKGRVRRWLSDAEPETMGGRHTTYLLKAGQTKQIFAPRSFLGAVHPGGQGLALIVHQPGAAAHVSFEWHERATS